MASNPPVRWSVARGEGIVWKTPLPEEGQSGIAVWNDRLFLTTLKPEEGAKPKGREVVVYCLDAADGKIALERHPAGPGHQHARLFFQRCNVSFAAYRRRACLVFQRVRFNWMLRLFGKASLVARVETHGRPLL